jgi:hypothetical protein
MMRRFTRAALITECVGVVDVVLTERAVGVQKVPPGRPVSLDRTMISG